MIDQGWMKIGTSAVGTGDGYTIFAEVGSYGKFLEKRAALDGRTYLENNLGGEPDADEVGYLVAAKRRDSWDNYFYFPAEFITPGLPVLLDSLVENVEVGFVLDLVDERGPRPVVDSEDKIMPHWKFRDGVASAMVDEIIVSITWRVQRHSDYSLIRLWILVIKPGAGMDAVQVDADELFMVSGASVEDVAAKYSPAEMLELYESNKV